ncbi:glycosyltransferase [Candidatus Pacearchaeota archaeon]|nr:glycosyltransferase [Candidatus Pacearchaeota archaeon]
MNILIIKVSAMGDVVRCTFLAQAMRDKYKKFKPKIYWLTDKNVMDIFINNPYVEKVYSMDEKDMLKNVRFDLVLNLEESEDLSKFANSLNPKEIMGFMFKNGKMTASSTAKKWFDMSLLGKKPQNDILKLSCKKTHRELMSEIIGVPYQNYEPFLRLNKYQINLLNNFSKKNNLNKNDMVVGLFLGGADRWKKSLSIDLSMQLIDEIYKKFKCKIVLFGGPNEKERNNEILGEVKVPIVDAGTNNSIKDLIAKISVCNYFISTDTLTLHIALGLKKKTIVLLGPTVVNEKENYPYSRKVLAKSNCINCLKRDCDSMDKIDIKEVISKLTELSKKPKLDIVITSYKEPQTKRAIEKILEQKINYDYEIIVSAPDKETQDIVNDFIKKDKRIRLFKDPGKGKNLALNLIFKELFGDILIFTDGDVYLKENSINEIADIFNDSTVGCVTGRPVPEEDKSTKYGYFANFLFNEAHKMREKSYLNHKFLECSGYLFAFRNNIIKKFPLDTAEDTIIPYYFYEKGYEIGYPDKSIVIVKNVDNWKDWIDQKIRTSKAHEKMDRYVDTQLIPREKSFSNEAKGVISLLKYPNNIKEFFWSVELMFARLYMWYGVFYEVFVKKKGHSDAWNRVESTK